MNYYFNFNYLIYFIYYYLLFSIYFKFLFILLSILFLFSSSVQASIFNGAPEVVDKLNSAFEKIEDWLLILATPAAAVAVAVGAFMKKFSFGDEERIRIAKKLIRGSLVSLTDTIIQTINSIFQTLFSSIDNSVYSILDNLTFINSSILNDSLFENLFGTNSSNGILLIANSLLIGFSIYYAIRLLYSYYMNLQVERPYQFIFKLLIFGIIMNCSYFFCEQLLTLNSFLSDAIRGIGSSLLGHEISFSELINELNSIISVGETDFNIFSFDGLIKGFISIGLFNLIFSYSLRFILIKIFILLTPFAILSLINQSTSWLFKTCFRTLLSLLLQQSFVSIILLILFSVDFNTENVFSKLVYIGGIYALIKANSYMRSLIGGISTDVSANLNLGNKLVK